MTTIYFMRNTKASMPLATQFFAGQPVDVIFSAPEVDAIQMIRTFATKLKASAFVLDELRDIEGSNLQNEQVVLQMFADENYKWNGMESYHQIQERMIDALQMMVNDYQDKTIVVSTHVFPMSTVIEYFDSSFSHNDYKKMCEKAPYMVKLEFEGETCLSMEDILCV